MGDLESIHFDVFLAAHLHVDGTVVKKPETQVSGQENIKVDGLQITHVEEKVYFILNKPKGYLCSNAGRKRVIDMFQEQGKRLFTVGRLDRDTEGLLIVTNDGHFSHAVIHPSANLEKEYLVKTDHEITAEHLKVIQNGTVVEGVYVQPVKVKKVRRGTLKVIVTDGKKREVRRLVENAGLGIVSLKRIRIGGLLLGDLPLGNWRPLTKFERDHIFRPEEST